MGRRRRDKEKEAGDGAGREKLCYIAKAHLRHRLGWGGGRRPQACLSCSAVMLARCSSMDTLNCGCQLARRMTDGNIGKLLTQEIEHLCIDENQLDIFC